MNLQYYITVLKEKTKEFKTKIKRLNPTRYNRVMNYIHNLKSSIEIKDKRDKETAEELKEIAKKIIIKLERYYFLNTILYILIYFSFVSYFLRDIMILSDLAIILSKIVGILGTTFFFIAVFFSNKVIELYYQDLNLVTSHIIAIYTKYQKYSVEESEDREDNYYSEFIKFIKEKY